MVAPAIVDFSFKMAIGDISLSAASGWRASQEGMVKRFETDFPASYGLGLQRAPRLMLKDKEIPHGGQSSPRTQMEKY